jgi:hypothetical protein
MNKARRLTERATAATEAPSTPATIGDKKRTSDNAKVTFHLSHKIDIRLRQFHGGMQAPRPTLSELAETLLTEGLDKRGG